MPRIFISHSWEDNEIARKLAEYLKRDGAEIWIDYARIEGGDSLPEVISKAIDWCDTLVLVWSKSAAESYWVKEEWTAAHALKKKIIPCLLDSTILPSLLSSKLYLELNTIEQGYRSLAKSLKLVVKDSKTFPIKKIEKLITAEAKKDIFRSHPLSLSRDEVIKIITEYDFFDASINPSGRGFSNQFKIEKYSNIFIKDFISMEKVEESILQSVIIDNASGLMWQLFGSPDELKFNKALKYIDKIRNEWFAGFGSSWRLPTIEEAMSLMKPEKKHGLYIDPIFGREQKWIWTADSTKGGFSRWVVNFSLGTCDTAGFIYLNYNSVRAVRSM